MTAKQTKHDQADDQHLVEAARKSMDQIWQAGLGAFARAQQEGGDMFSRLVQEGLVVQKRTQNMAGERLTGLADMMTRMADSLGRQAAGSLERLESAFEERMVRSLQGMGVPTREDIQALSAQIQALQQSVELALARQPAARATAAEPASRRAAKSAPTPAKKRAAAKPKSAAKTAATAGKRSTGSTAPGT